jgi:hypothetical protein
MDGKGWFRGIIAITFAADRLALIKHTFINLKRLFTMVEITVVLPVPAYPLSTKSYHFDLQLKNSNLLKKIS